MATINITEGTYLNALNSSISKNSKNNLDECQIIVPFNFSVSIADEVNLYDKDSTLIFKGLVQNIKIGNNKELVIFDYGVQLMDINVNEIYISQKAEDIIEDIVNKTDLTYVSTITTSSTITTYLIKDKTGWESVTELAELLNASFRVDKNKNFYLELIEEDMSTETITTENAVIDDDWNQDADQLINKITVIGDKQLFEKTETFDGDGTTTTFTLAEFPVDVNVTVGGTEQTGYVEGATAIADYSVTTGTKDIIFASGSIPGVGTGNVIVRYTFAIDIKLVSQDSASIVSYGGPNLIAKEKKIVKPYITSFQEARNFANFYLGIYAQPLLTSTWIINDYTKFENFVPNQKIIVTDSIRGISDTFIIKKVEREFPGQLKVEIGWPEDDILDWNKEVQYRIKQLEEIDNNSTILQEYGFIENKVQLQVTSTVERELERTLPDDNLFFFNAIDGLVGWWKGNGNALDYSGNSNNGTWAGTEAYATGKQFDEAFDFDGINSYIALNSETSISTLGGSISLWVNPAVATTNLFIGDGIGFKNWFGINLNAYTFSLDSTEQHNGGTSTPNVLTNVILVFDNNEYYIYENGIVVTSGTISATSSLIIKQIGGIPTLPNYFKGLMGDVRIYNRGLSITEANSIYNAGLGLTSNANIAEVGLGEDRVLSDEISGLIFWSKLDGNAIDYSGYNNNGTWSGTELYDVGKQFDLCGDFDTTNYVNAGDITEFHGLTDMTISLWFKIDSTIITNPFITKGEYYNATSSFALARYNSNRIVFSVANSAFSYTSPSLSIDTWYHLVVRYSNSTNYMNFRLNNTSIKSGLVGGSYVDIPISTHDVRLGSDSNSANMDGNLQDMRVYNRLLTTDEITVLYNSGLGSIDNAINELSDGTLGTKYLLSDNNIYNLNPDSEISNLESYYDMNGDSVDSVGGNNGTDTDITYVTGKIGQAASFNGSTSGINIGTFTGSQTKTIMMWFNSSSISTTQRLISRGSGTGNDFMIQLYQSKIRVVIGNDGGGQFVSSQTSTLSSTTWYHVAAIFDDSNNLLKTYINGELVLTDTTTTTLSITALATSLGVQADGSGESFNGLIDDVLIVSRAVTTDEIKARYNEGSGKPQKYQSWEDM